MNDLHDRIERLLPLVQNPAQYVGGEWNIVRKTLRPGMTRVAFVFPDTYAIGMSHLGLQVLYHVLNVRDDTYCERAFLPWTDMEALLRRDKLPLWSLETFTPLAELDVVAFSLQYELTYANVLNALDLAGIPLRSSGRSDRDPFVIAGGPGALNPEPLADFIDLFVVGDGEDTAPAFVEALRRATSAGKSRRDVLLDLARSNESFYVPAFYDVTYHVAAVAGVAHPPSGESASSCVAQPLAPTEERPSAGAASSPSAQAGAPVPHEPHPQCGRCGREVRPSDIEAGRAFGRDGVYLCEVCALAIAARVEPARRRAEAPAPAPAPSPAPATEEILREIQKINRALTFRQFSIWHVLGAVAQALAFGSLIGGYALGNGPMGLLWAIYFQLLALTLFVLGRM